MISVFHSDMIDMIGANIGQFKVGSQSTWDVRLQWAYKGSVVKTLGPLSDSQRMIPPWKVLQVQVCPTCLLSQAQNG